MVPKKDVFFWEGFLKKTCFLGVIPKKHGLGGVGKVENCMLALDAEGGEGRCEAHRDQPLSQEWRVHWRQFLLVEYLRSHV